MAVERFYHEGFELSKGIKASITPLRRVLRRLLRPMLVKLGDQIDELMTRLDQAESEIGTLHKRHEETTDQLHATIAFGWDYVAMTRRLAALEDEVTRLRADGRSPVSDRDQLVLPFRDLAESQTRARAS